MLRLFSCQPLLGTGFQHRFGLRQPHRKTRVPGRSPPF
jgi:hypothetical protein